MKRSLLITGLLLLMAGVGWSNVSPLASDRQIAELAVCQLRDDGRVATALHTLRSYGGPSPWLPVACGILGVSCILLSLCSHKLEIKHDHAQ